MRALGLDLGTKTLGVAITDRTNTLVSPLKTIIYSNTDELIKEVKRIVLEYGITDLVLGLPKNMDGSLGFAADRSMKFYEELKNNFDLNIHLIDERLSTVEAERILIDNADMSRGKRKKVIDSVAAMIILENYIKKEKNKNE
ncbi:MAG: Holliday junction resolvase RuvX [Bacilli bacterium]|nr:Holliday junction resolvase RuvX [Bacilli bacterium]